MTKKSELAVKLFTPLINQKVRTIQKGHGSFLTIGFGADILIHHTEEARTRPEWLLWVYMCFWSIMKATKILADSDDEREIIEEALKEIEGKKLLNVEVLSKTYDMKLAFEDGIVLSLFSNNAEDDNVQWRLFTPDSQVLVAGPNEELSYHSAQLKEESNNENS